MVAVAFALGVALAYELGRPGAVPAGGAPEAPASADGGYRYRRIVCMSPAIAEIVFAIGAGQRVVGVSEHTAWPPAATKVPTCGGFFDPNFERMLSLKPDLIIDQGEAADIQKFADSNGIQLELVTLATLEAILSDTERLGDLLQVGPQAQRVVADMRRRLDAVRARVRGLPVVSVLLVTGHDEGSLRNTYTVGPHTFLSELIEVAGGHNAFADLPVEYGAVNREAVIARRPDVIVELRGMGRDAARTEADVRRLWATLGTLPAVQNGRVYVVDSTYAMIPGPRVVELAEEFAGLFHPEAR
jgi:iron complex transport system substrate-binding protein